MVSGDNRRLPCPDIAHGLPPDCAGSVQAPAWSASAAANGATPPLHPLGADLNRESADRSRSRFPSPAPAPHPRPHPPCSVPLATPDAQNWPVRRHLPQSEFSYVDLNHSPILVRNRSVETETSPHEGEDFQKGSAVSKPEEARIAASCPFP